MSEMEFIRDGIKRIDTNIAAMSDGLGKLCIKVALHEQQLKELPTSATVKTYAFIGAGCFLAIGAFGYVAVVVFA